MNKIKAFVVLVVFILSMSVVTFAGTINTVTATALDGSITVKGVTDEDVLAIAIVVYNSSEELVYMETGSVIENKYDLTLEKIFSEGTYVVKVADYNGGEYKETSVIVSDEDSNTNTTTKTGDKSPVVLLSCLLIVSMVVMIIAVRKKKAID